MGGAAARLACSISLLAAGGCSHCDQSGSPVEIVGTGLTSFVPIRPDSVVPIIHGIQDGYHVWTSLLVSNVNLAGINLHYTLEFVDDGRVLNDFDENAVDFEPL